MKIQIYKRKIYITPRPKKDIPQGLVVVLNKPREEGKEPFIVADIEAGKKEYKLPDMSPGYFVVRILIKKDGRKNKN